MDAEVSVNILNDYSISILKDNCEFKVIVKEVETVEMLHMLKINSIKTLGKLTEIKSMRMQPIQS